MFLLIFIGLALILLILAFSLFEIFLLILLVIQYSQNRPFKINMEKSNQILMPSQQKNQIYLYIIITYSNHFVNNRIFRKQIFLL